MAIERGAAHQSCDLLFALASALIAIGPDPRLPWLPTRPTRWRWLRHKTVWAAGRPLLVLARLLDELIGQVVRRTRGGNTYRVLARKNG